MKKLEDIRIIIPQKKKKDRISKNFERVVELIKRYNPPLYPSVSPVEDYKKNNDSHDDAA